jgi:hypothetical protein
MLTLLGFELKLDIFLNLKTIVHNTIICNRARIWDSQGWNADFWSVFIMKCFSVKPNANPFEFWAETQYFLKPIIFYTVPKHLNETEYGYHGDEIWIFWPVFAVNKCLSVQQMANPFEFWDKTIYFLKKPQKIWYNTIMSNREKYGSHGDKIRFLARFVVKICFSVKPMANPLWFLSRNSKFFNNNISNRAIIWALWRWNMNFRPIYFLNRHLSAKPKAKPFGFWETKLDIFQNLNKIVYNTVISNRARIWAWWEWSRDFWLILVVNGRLSVKSNANPIRIWAET